MFTNLFASVENVFLQSPVSHPFSYLTNWMQFSTRSLHKRFVRAPQKNTNKWFILLMTLKLKKTVENSWKLEHCKQRIQNQKPEPEVFFVIRWENSNLKMIVTDQWNETTLARILTQNCFYFDLIFILLIVFSELILVCCWQINIKCYLRNVGALNGECTLIRWYAFTSVFQMLFKKNALKFLYVKPHHHAMHFKRDTVLMRIHELVSPPTVLYSFEFFCCIHFIGKSHFDDFFMNVGTSCYYFFLPLSRLTCIVFFCHEFTIDSIFFLQLDKKTLPQVNKGRKTNSI